MQHPYQELIARKISDLSFSDVLADGNAVEVAPSVDGALFVITHWEVRCKAGADPVDFVVTSDVAETFRMEFSEGQGMVEEPWLRSLVAGDAVSIQADNGAAAEGLQVNLRGFYYRDA